ncbi:hypothetical protein [Cyclobacterium sp.]|uniref:hypothetical protein n=1 Tax=Cyclobacterium sp. TaxID=1966343 RepID=UPI0019BF12E7|nr:hypothetical protein [Cyclobacterium sp.]MBD3627617.1 hypothetical protein [Cyclobacterium sp.]
MIPAKELQKLIDKLPDPNKHPETPNEYKVTYWPDPTVINRYETQPPKKRCRSYVFVKKEVMGKQEWFFSHID